MILLTFKGLKIVCGSFMVVFVYPYAISDGSVDREEGGEEETDSNGTSHFSFLNNPKDKDGNDESDSEKSNDEHSSSGFSFLNQPSDTPCEQQAHEEEDQGHGLEQMKALSGSEGSSGDAKPQTSLFQPTEKEEKSNVMSRSPLKSPGQKVGRQLPPAAAHKRKKKKAVRPGQENIVASHAEEESPSVVVAMDTAKDSDHGSENVEQSQEVTELETQKVNESSSVVAAMDTAKDSAGSSENIEQSQEVTELEETQKKEVQEEVDGSLTEDVTIETEQPLVDVTNENNVPSLDVSMAAENVPSVTGAQEDPTSNTDVLDVEDESHALEEVFGNYHIELSGEDNLAALLQSYQSGIKKIR